MARLNRSRARGRRNAARNSPHAQEPSLSWTPVESFPFLRRIKRSDTHLVGALALVMMVIISYLPAVLWGGFVWDDVIFQDALPVRELSGLWEIWFSPGAIERHYWPMTYSSFWLEHKLWGFAPAGYHAVNVLLHLVNTMLVWYLLRRMAVPGAWVIAAVFAVHPLHVESVAWIIERKDVLSGLFYFSAALLYMRFAESPRPRYYMVALALFTAGLLSKSIVVTLPAALLIWHWWKSGRITVQDALRLAPFFAVGFAITLADLFISQSQAHLSLEYSILERVLIASRALWWYAGKIILPIDLSIIYPLWDISVMQPLAWLYVVGAAAVAAALWLLRDRIGRGPMAGALFFAVTLSPTLGFVDYDYMLYSFVADRYQYIAGIGVMAVVVGCAAHGVTAVHSAGRLPVFASIGILGVKASVLVAFGMLTWQQSSVYRDNITLNSHIISHNPQARHAHMNLGDALLELDRVEDALEAYGVAIEQSPNDAELQLRYGWVLIRQGRFDEAEPYFQRASEVNAFDKNYLLGWAVLLNQKGNYEEAVDELETLIDLHPQDSQAYALLGEVLTQMGLYEEALDALDRALAIAPGFEGARTLRGEVLVLLEGSGQ